MVRGPDPLREGQRTAEPAARGLRPEPDLVRDRRTDRRAARLDSDDRPVRRCPPLGAQAPPAAHLHRRGRLASSGRRLRLRLAGNWPWGG